MMSFLKYRKFQPPREWADRFESTLNEFRKICASDAFVSGAITKYETRYIVEVSVRSLTGHIGVRTESSDLDQLMKLCMAKLHEQIRLWRLTRFKGIFALDSVGKIEIGKAHNQSSLRPRVLLVEDNPAAATVLESIMSQAGFFAVHVEDTQKALIEIANHRYDLILIDWCLPFMTGGEILEKAIDVFSHGAGPSHSIPVVTCSAMPESEIHIPVSKYFRHVAHWDKSESVSSILKSARALLA